MSTTIIILVAVVIIAICVIGYLLWKNNVKSQVSSEQVVKEKKYIRASSNELLIVTNSAGEMRILQGGSVEDTPENSYSKMPLSAISWEGVIRTMSSENIPVNVPISITAAVGNTDDARRKAISRFLSSQADGIRAYISSIAEGAVRKVMGGIAIADTIHSDNLRENSKTEIAKELEVAGLEILAFMISDITDDSDYIKSLSQKEISKVKTAAQSELMAQQKLDAIQAEKDRTELEVAKNNAELERLTAKQESDGKLREIRKSETIANAEAEREVQVKTAEIKSDQNTKIAYAQAKSERAKKEAQLKNDLELNKIQQDAHKEEETHRIKTNSEIEKERAKEQAEIYTAQKEAEAAIEKAEIKKAQEIQDATNAKILENQKAQAEQTLARTEADKQNAIAKEKAQQEISKEQAQTATAKAETEKIKGIALADAEGAVEKAKAAQQVEIAKAKEQALEAEINATTILQAKKEGEKKEIDAQAKKKINKINAESAAEKSGILAEAEANAIEKKAIATAKGKEADLLAEAKKIAAIEESGVKSVKALLDAGIDPDVIVRIRTIDQIKGVAESQSALLEQLKFSDVTILGDSKTVGDFIANTTNGISPALEKLRNLPLNKAVGELEEKNEDN